MVRRSGSSPRAGRPAPSWLLVGSLFVVFVTVLLVSGFSSAEIGNDAKGAHEQGDSEAVPASVLEGGAIVDGRQSPATSTGVPAKTIVLTFDDGPDPTWTPQILAVLRKHNVPGTFFVVGSMASRYPDLIRAIHDQGSELGVHTFSHPDLVDVPQWRLEREMSETQLAITGATGTSTYLMRPPYSSSVDALDDRSYETVRQVGAMGYLTIFTNVDSEDWQRPGVQAIIHNATPQDGTGGTVLMHDAGGDRSQTVAALDQLIPQLQSRGYTFTTTTGAIHLPPQPQASQRDDILGGLLLGTIGTALWITDAARWILVAVATLVVIRLVLMILAARRHTRRRRDPNWAWGPPVTEPVTVVVPAYNESKNIESTVRSILANDHPLEVVVVDDGSTDGTADLVEALGLARVRVVRQLNAGKSAALNTGTANARYDIVIMIDGDTIFEPDTVRHLAQPFGDPKVGAVAGNVKVANTDTLIGRLQHIEYVVGFGIDRRVQDTTHSITTIPGAAGAFRKSALREVGGLSDDTLAEDTDLTIALGRAGWRVVFEDRALAWTEAPATAGQLWRQRYRWSYGTMQALWKHRRSIREPGSFGLVGLAHVLLFQILLPLTAPLVDIFLLYGLIFEDPATTLLLWTLMMGLQLASGLYAFHVDGEPKNALWVLPVQQVVYRQLMYVVLVQSTISAVSGVRVRWQKLQRTGAVDALMSPRRAPVPPPVPRKPESVLPAPRSPEPPAPRPSGGRERWLDSLRAAALIRVVVYHALSLGWLSIVFPSMGVMFALGGSLMVQSFRKMPSIDVIGHRIRRLLPPLWLLGLILVPIMVWQGWAAENDNAGVPWRDLVFWVFPILDPPGSDWAFDAVEVLWYIRAYLWFVLLTPAMLAAFRRWPVASILTPLLLVAVDALLGSPLAGASGIGSGLLDFLTFGACWMLGFAHREGKLKQLPRVVLLGLAAVAVAAGVFWAQGHPSPDSGLDLNDIPLAQALVSAGAVLLFLRVNPRMGWVDRVPGLGRLITVVNSRAITIYLTNNIAIDGAAWLNDRYGLPSEGWPLVGTSFVLVALAIPLFGWVEDLAAHRPLQIIPGGRRAVRKPKADTTTLDGASFRPRTLAAATSARIAAVADTTVLPVVPRATESRRTPAPSPAPVGGGRRADGGPQSAPSLPRQPLPPRRGTAGPPPPQHVVPSPPAPGPRPAPHAQQDPGSSPGMPPPTRSLPEPPEHHRRS
ncbi:glycosyltransferase [Pseudonocardia sp. T1-2H]|uniref:glycosyltransferase n=1 Tax=Pseudonocardia sp. T1-2H TaxID=3128899 RepID=UPI003100D801